MGLTHPYVTGAIAAITFGKLSDHFFWRMPFVSTPFPIITVGYSIIVSLKGDPPVNVGLSIFAVILKCVGIYPIPPANSSWAANNMTPVGRRAVGLGFVICVGNIGGIVRSYMYLDSEKAKYYTGLGLSIAFGIIGILVAIALGFFYLWGSKKRAKLTEHEIEAMHSEDELLRMGEQSPLFMYTT